MLGQASTATVAPEPVMRGADMPGAKFAPGACLGAARSASMALGPGVMRAVCAVCAAATRAAVSSLDVAPGRMGAPLTSPLVMLAAQVLEASMLAPKVMLDVVAFAAQMSL